MELREIYKMSKNRIKCVEQRHSSINWFGILVFQINETAGKCMNDNKDRSVVKKLYGKRYLQVDLGNETKTRMVQDFVILLRFS